MIAFLFPGQGAQVPGMLHALGALPGGTALVERAGALLVRDLLANDTATGYRSTATTQRALFVAGVAGGSALIERGVIPAAVAGHSVGAYAAAVVAGILDFETGLRLVDLRGRAMEAAFPAGYGMGAIGGLDERRVRELVATITRPADPVYAANVNADDQIAIAGSLAGIDATLDAARTAGARSVRRLDVGVPSHSPLMHAVASALACAVDTAVVRTARIPYTAPSTGRIVRDPERIRADLVHNVELPVRWADATRALYEFGVRTFIEMPPGHVLSDLAAVAFPDARAIGLETAGLDRTSALADRAH